MANRIESYEPNHGGLFRLAILITCHNRRETTLLCLKALFAQEGLPPWVSLCVYLVDDGSSDGTAAEVHNLFPWVNVINGSGDLFWAGGMRLAWTVAAKSHPDGYLWLNDDTHLFSDALARLCYWHQHFSLYETPFILVGSTCDAVNGRLTYGGRLRGPWYRPIPKASISPGDNPVICHTFNGNCVWVPTSVVQRIGIFGPEFQHGLADLDYGFRATRAGLPIWILPGFLGSCAVNRPGHSWASEGLLLWERWQRISNPKGLPPKEFMLFAIRHGGWVGPLIAFKPYLDLIRRHFLPQSIGPAPPR